MMADSEGEENTMRTNQPDMVRQSLEATAHPDVYARRKVAEKVEVTVVSALQRGHGDEQVAQEAAVVVIESDLRAPIPTPTVVAHDEAAVMIGDGQASYALDDDDDPDHCTCATSAPDVFGNCDLIEQDDCPVHGGDRAARERRLRDEWDRLPRDHFALPDSADTRLHDPGMADLGRRREGWRGRLAHIEMLLARFEDESTPDDQLVTQALAELRAMIDGA